MKLILYCMLLITAVTVQSLAEYSEAVASWPQVRLRLSEQISIADLFAAGLHPYHSPGLANMIIESKHSRIIVAGDAVEFPQFPSEQLEVFVDQPHLITQMTLKSPPLTFNEVRAEMTKWLPYTKKTSAELEAFLAAVKRDWLHYDTVNGKAYAVTFRSTTREPNGLRYSIWLMKAYHWDTPLRLCFTVDCNLMESRKRLKSYDGPIPPPPGYENVSMDPPKNWGPDNPYIPLTTEYRSPPGSLPPSAKLLPDGVTNNDNTNLKTESHQHAVTLGTDTSHKTKGNWIFWGVLTLAAISLISLILKKRNE